MRKGKTHRIRSRAARRLDRLRPRRTRKRRSHARSGRKHHARRGGYRYGGKRYSRRTPKSHRLPEGGTTQSYSGGYVLSNPLSAGELVLVGITGIAGYGLADFVGRYLSTAAVASGAAANSIPAGQTVPNDVATTAFPSWTTIAAQFGVAAVPGIASAFVDSPWGRAALQGMMLGAGFALFGGLFKSAMASMLSSNPLGQQLYLAEIEAQAAVTAAGGSTTSTSTTTTAPATTAATGMAGLPRGVGRPPLMRAPQGMAQVPVSSVALPTSLPLTGPMPQPPSTAQIPSGGPGGTEPPLAIGGGGSIPTQAQPIRQPMFPPGILTNTGDVIPTPPPGTPVGPNRPTAGPECAPCSPTYGGIAGAHTMAANGLGSVPKKMGMYGTFPEE